MLAYEILSDFIPSPARRNLYMFFNYICYWSEKKIRSKEKSKMVKILKDWSFKKYNYFIFTETMCQTAKATMVQAGWDAGGWSAGVSGLTAPNMHILIIPQAASPSLFHQCVWPCIHAKVLFCKSPDENKTWHSLDRMTVAKDEVEVKASPVSAFCPHSPKAESRC